MTFVVGLSGHRGSGKTWLANELASTRGFAQASFGDVVRSEALRLGLVPTMEVLQDLGGQLIHEWGTPGLCRRALSSVPPDSDVVIEGIRHAEVLHALRNLAAPRQFVFVFVDLDVQARRRRLQARDGDDGLTRDAHLVEAEVDRLKALANLVVDGATPQSPGLVIQHLVALDPSWRPSLTS
ncbi:MAG: AAA family ATPase [Burkholderiales bacterium]|nr:AAA family ATPase [Burkholderiales bacterium]